MDFKCDIKIIGFDAKRPPRIQSIPCIDLVLELDQEVPKEWCDQFIAKVGKVTYPIKIDPKTRLYLETWVRKPNEIEGIVEKLKATVAEANAAYIKALQIAANIDPDEVKVTVTPEQLALDKLVNSLKFD